ncbi:ribosomal-protein-alanine acetyltransferase [Enterococcus saigonensis]|uniref:Ribosomal-protein-alanine acetyltransferase n=2 Tax=Enterococcus saigonensis TaxID=1805431 RepID=A0A679IB63_9ENTE|nr:ribosomal-protein-alanine acetyltransferase [Enterococcus saigonensis]
MTKIMLKKFKAFFPKPPFKSGNYTKRPYIDNPNWFVREVANDDIKALLAVERNVYHGELPWTKSAFLTELISPLPHLYLCVENETILAFAGCRIIGNDAHITNIAVDPNFQGNGIGTFLMQELEHFAKKNNCLTMSLEVRLSNRDAQRLYRKLGYVSRAIKAAYYDQTNEDALDMVKYID